MNKQAFLYSMALALQMRKHAFVMTPAAIHSIGVWGKVIPTMQQAQSIPGRMEELHQRIQQLTPGRSEEALKVLQDFKDLPNAQYARLVGQAPTGALRKVIPSMLHGLYLPTLGAGLAATALTGTGVGAPLAMGLGALGGGLASAGLGKLDDRLMNEMAYRRMLKQRRNNGQASPSL